jgi:hypothetical protein
LLSGQDCPECGGSYSDAVQWSRKKRPIHLIILTALVLVGVCTPVILRVFVEPYTYTGWDVTDGLEIFFIGISLWFVTGLTASWSVIYCALHIGKTRWTPLVWLMLAVHASVVLAFAALFVYATFF